MKIKKSYLVFAGAALFPCVALFAQDSEVVSDVAEQGNSVPAENAQDKTITGKAVRVTAARHEMEMADVPMSVGVVSGEGVEKSSVATVSDLIGDVPGVQIESTGSAGFKQVNIRGEGNQRVLILVDGQKISETKGMNGAPLLISVQDIERTEVIKGPASVLYGSEAIGGVVNIITKKSGKEGVHGSAGVRADTGTRGFDQYYDLNAREGAFSARVSWSDENHGDIESPDGRVDRTSFRFQNASAYFAYDISENSTLGAKIELFRGRSDVFTGADTIFMELPDWDRDKVGVFLETKDISDTFVKFKLDAYMQKTDKNFLQNITQRAGPMLVNVDAVRRNKHYSYGAETQADFSFADEHYLIVGAQLDYLVLDSKENTATSVTVPGGSNTRNTTTNTYDADILTAALFAQDEWTFAEGWTFVLGGRGTYVRNELKSGKSRVVRSRPPGTTETRLASKSDDDANAVFSVSLVNSLLEDWTFRATVAQGYRYASVNELYIGSAMAGSVTHANPDLDPERSISYELGTRYERGGARIDATIFCTDADDYIGTRTRATGTGTTEVWFVNYNSARTFGAELSASYEIGLGETATVKPYVVSTFLRRRFEDSRGSTYATGQPKFFGKIGVLGTLEEDSRNWWADLNLRGNAASETKVSGTGSSSSIERTAGWATVNFSVGADIFSKGAYSYFEKLTLAVGVDNLFDARYELPNLSFAQPGRSFWASLKYEF